MAISKKTEVMDALQWMLSDILDNRNYQVAYYPDVIRKTMDLIMSQPEVIRCKDCKHYMEPSTGYSYSECMAKPGYFPVTLDGYCPDGKRKEVI